MKKIIYLQVLLSINLILTAQSQQGTAETHYSGTTNHFFTEYVPSENAYRLVDTERRIRTLNCMAYYPEIGEIPGEISDTNHYYNNNQNNHWITTCDGKYILDAHWAMIVAHDYFAEHHNRFGYSNDRNKWQKCLFNVDGGAYDAAWNPDYELIMFVCTDGICANQNATLDIITHEFGHGVTYSFVKLNTKNFLVSALSEGLSDIWGACVENYANETFELPSDKDVWTQGIETQTLFRFIRNPNSNGFCDTYMGKYWNFTKVDFANYENSTVLSHWFYLLSEGKADTNDFGHEYSVKGIGIENAAKIVYNSLSSLVPDSEIPDFSSISMESAEELFGKNSPEAIATQNAWQAVGLYYPVYTKPFTHKCSITENTYYSEYDEYVYDFIVQQDGIFDFSTISDYTEINTTLAVYDKDWNLIAYNDDSNNPSNPQASEVKEVYLNPGKYTIMVNSNELGKYELNVSHTLSPCWGFIPVSFYDSYNDGNEPQNTMDCNLSTRWSSYGDNNWISYKLDNAKMIDRVAIAWFKGNQRSAYFDIEVSMDEMNWIKVVDGGVSSGNTLNSEYFSFDPLKARYIRYMGHGNSSNMWNSITEFQIHGASLNCDDIRNLAYEKPILSSSGYQTGNPPQRIVDGIESDPANRWSVKYNTAPQWVEIDLGNICQINETQLIAYEDRDYQFTIEAKASLYDIYQVIVDRRSNIVPGTYEKPITNTFDPIDARYIKLTIYDAHTYEGSWSSIQEFKVYGCLPGYDVIELEAEDGYITGNFSIGSDLSASNDGYIWYPNGSINTSPTDHASYEFYVEDPGTYIIWGRVKTPSYGDDSFWVTLDDNDFVAWNNMVPSSSWYWYKVYDASNREIMEYYLDNNWHYLDVDYREDGAKVDKWIITNDPYYEPEGLVHGTEASEVELAQSMERNKLKLYPVPPKNFLTVEIPSDAFYGSVEICDITGKIIKKISIDQNSTIELNVSDLQSGYYIIRTLDSRKEIVGNSSFVK